MTKQILVFNIGSASFRWSVFDADLKRCGGETVEYPKADALPNLTEEVLDKNIRDSAASTTAIGHRVVHGGSDFRKPVVIDEGILSKLDEISGLAPLHNPPAIAVIRTCRRLRPNVANIACFDTSYFVDLPDYAKFYAIPMETAEKYHILRYGFHGLSHEYLANEAAQKLSRPLEDLKLITCHLGSGASITAIEDGRPIDTSMGFTPLEGLMMATRVGDLDPSIPLFLENQGLGREEINQILNTKSGLLGVSGFSGDVRDITRVINDAQAPTEERARAGLALQMYAYRIKKYIGAYAVSLGGLDALVFTGAVAEGSELVREMITHGLKDVLGEFETLVIPSNEELTIANKIQKLLNP